MTDMTQAAARVAYRYIPSGSTPVTQEGVDAVVYVSEKTDGAGKLAFYGIAYAGKSGKSVWNYRFATEAQRQKRIDELFAGRVAHAAYTAERKAERKAITHTLKAGDILYASWGYDQTNIDFYQVTEVKSPKTVVIREIESTSTGEDGFMTAKCSAVKDAFKGDPMLKRVGAGNYVGLTSYSSAGPWDGQPKRYSWYA